MYNLQLHKNNNFQIVFQIYELQISYSNEDYICLKILNDDLLHVLTSNLTFLIDSYLHIHQKFFEEIYQMYITVNMILSLIIYVLLYMNRVFFQNEDFFLLKFRSGLSHFILTTYVHCDIHILLNFFNPFLPRTQKFSEFWPHE